MIFTKNLGLHIWDASDPFLRQHINQDHQKIEDALGNRMEIIFEAVGEENVYHAAYESLFYREQTANPLNKIDLNDWTYFAWLVNIPTYEFSQKEPLMLKWYNMDGNFESQTIGSILEPGFLLVLLPFHDASRNTVGFVLHDKFVPFRLDIPFSQFGGFMLTDEAETYKRVFGIPHVTVFGAR